MKHFVAMIFLTASLLYCQETPKPLLKEGIWRGTIEVQDQHTLPFNFSIERNDTGYLMEVYNAEETLVIDEISFEKDSIFIQMPVFEGYIAGHFKEDRMDGHFIIKRLGRVAPFHAIYGDSARFYKRSRGLYDHLLKERNRLLRSSNEQNPVIVNLDGQLKALKKDMESGLKSKPKHDVSGIWETEFGKGTGDTYMAKGIFKQQGEKVTGTFRTITGDYRFLEGLVEGDSLKLSTMDGAHAFLFLARVTDSTLRGTFYSGKHFKAPFEGKRNDSFELPDPESLTFLKEGYEKLSFTFPDASGNKISLDDPKYKDKVVIVQIMGTWCPNSLDESKFLVQYLANHPEEDLEVIALAVEYATTEKEAIKGINRLKEGIGVPYPVLLAQYGSWDKKAANEKLPMLNHILSYPTTIFIDKKGKVRKIYTAFNGPATGEKYEEFSDDFDTFVKTLLAE